MTDGANMVGVITKTMTLVDNDTQISVERERVVMLCRPPLRLWGLHVRGSVRYSTLL